MMRKSGWLLLGSLLSLATVWAFRGSSVSAAGPVAVAQEGYRVLAPIESGNLLLFPVVKAGGKLPEPASFLTLDEGIKSGQVEVTEAGKVRGLVRPRGGVLDGNRFQGDQVNTLVLVNNSGRPLLLLAGEIVTGGKQDRVISKDRIVPAGGDPIDLSVFCIEPGRWTESSAKFGATARNRTESFMVQPAVREEAMVAKDQQKVWSAVGGAISNMQVVAASPASSATVTVTSNQSLDTTSYAKAMQNDTISARVDEAAAKATQSREQVLAQLRQEHAVGVVVAVRGEIVWADLFADTDLLSRYWTKLVRSYAAESLSPGETHAAPTVADAQRFLDMPSTGAETSSGEVGVYRFSEVKAGATDTFVLESLLPPASFDVHISKLKLLHPDRRIQTGVIVR